ncbi:hypothetical protein [Pantoea dispersa]|uniref:Uncharacterized protein n=1 Tax=Pantoea dispersa TaxID=59814 RepID=A0A8E1S252_9GAMM|nr:hypothetical protein [Pantoea dispersa]KTR91409.1 hypothetical protein SA2_06390 [Pantoea dispersa]KTS23910.1 hypothetical protein SA4R_03170 [Pantoea dispersa]KTS56549.1 hypothetical protein SA5R_19385 [Pantoea dispersa]KTS69501.1 hypothetical protein SA3R_02430 [Pantoea dispersa]
MAGQQKKYVFRELVQDRTDALQLISYAIYKSHKDERAIHFRATVGEENVDIELQKWHDSIVDDPQWLDNYRNRADLLVKAIETQAVQDAMPTITQAHQVDINSLKGAHKIEVDGLKDRALVAEKKARDEWAEATNIWALNQTKPGWWKRNSLAFLKVVGGSVISVLGGAIATACLVGGLAMVSPTLSATANSIAKGLVDKLLPNEDPSGLGIKSFTNEESPNVETKKPD